MAPDRRAVATLATVAAAACAAPASTPPPAPPSSPDVPGLTAPDASILTALHDAARVEGLEDRRFAPEHWWEVVEPHLDGPGLQVEEVGRSAEGRPIRQVTWGQGATRVLLWSQMHGDESTASMALADLIRFLAGRPDHPLARTLREGVTLHMVPILNPDGAARFQRRNAQGVDVNRDARALATPEGRALKAVRDRVEPDFAFNLHDQGVQTRVGASDRGVAIALLAPAVDSARTVTPVRERAMRVGSVIAATIDPLVGGHVARYDDTFNPRAFGDLMGRWGASTVLIESGGWAGDPQKQHLRRTNFVALLAALEAIATGRWRDVGPARYRELPPNGRRIGDLLVSGGTLAIPGLPPLRADLLVRFEQPLLQEGGTVVDVGDLGGYEAMDTLAADGLFLVPDPGTLERGEDGVHLPLGAPARFVAARRADGSGVVWRFEERPPRGGR